MKRISFVLLMLISTGLLASGHGAGKIAKLTMAGSNFSSHPNIAQFQIEGGFTLSGCSAIFAGVRVEDAHLVSTLLAAKMADKEVEVYLNINDKYYDLGANPDRCVATMITVN